ncbi:helix-turn-helix domain-containing protein [Alkalimarinus alittae]|uniref:Helix-turn-helix domain-containing protein n=1 Tax=Alkalimarinus alittae TaxID=2961619 RepID=A0ABY6N6K0_9ALTE|nr:helix-turn-helix transcriptional regulator [Alkalimarinus alittae]UZE97650.1 helix-turn-helix domain-containing protein [Alkalimarinus alittae]
MINADLSGRLDMKYLRNFYKHLKQLREDKRLTEDDISVICQVDASVVRAWESEQPEKRCFPTIDNLIDLCLKTGTPLETLLALNYDREGEEQLELPGLAFIDEHDVNLSLDYLHNEIEKLLPTEDEVELLKRYRRSDDENKKLILQLMV